MTTSIRFPSAGMWGRNVTLREIERTTPTTIIVGYLPPSGKLLSRMSACVWRAARRASARGLAHQARPRDCAPYLADWRVGHQSRKSEREMLRSDFLSFNVTERKKRTYLRYCSSLTISIQSTVLLFSAS